MKKNVKKELTKDEIIDQLLEKVVLKRKDIENISNPVFKTNLSFLPLGGQVSNRINLNVANEQTLFGLLSWVESIMESSIKLPEKYQISFDPMWYGYTYEDWRDDLVLKIKQKQFHRKKRELAEIEERLKTLMSEDKKKGIELKELLEKLSD
jgi:hypothetical protein